VDGLVRVLTSDESYISSSSPPSRRALAEMPRPRWMRSGRALAKFSVYRLVFAVAYFVYVFVPGCPQSDVFVVADILVFSTMSGYLGIISYEYAAREFDTCVASTHSLAVSRGAFLLWLLPPTDVRPADTRDGLSSAPLGFARRPTWAQPVNTRKKR
jgi:hypothetical protein